MKVEVIAVQEKRMLRALVQRDETALKWFIYRYCAYVSTIVYNIIGQTMSHADVEEVTSDVFLVLWLNAGKISAGKVKAYIGAIARNKAKEKTRELGHDIPLEDDLIVIADDNPESAYEIHEQAEILKKAVLSMPHPDKEIFLRYYFYYQPIAQIGKEMDINISTVKTHLRRGRLKLKESLSKGGI